jgi:sulfur-carrier protein
MIIRVKLFARARDLAGADQVEVSLPDGGTVADLRRVLSESTPALAGLLPRCAVAVEGDFARDEQVIPAQAEVAVLPPVSGG